MFEKISEIPEFCCESKENEKSKNKSENIKSVFAKLVPFYYPQMSKIELNLLSKLELSPSKPGQVPRAILVLIARRASRYCVEVHEKSMFVMCIVIC